MKYILSFLIIASFFSCQKEKIQVDSIVINANIYTVNEAFDKAEAFAVKDRKFIAIGTSEDIQNSYTSENIIDVKGQTSSA